MVMMQRGYVYGAAGVDTTKLRLADGSGLSRVNVVTPQMTTPYCNLCGIIRILQFAMRFWRLCLSG